MARFSNIRKNFRRDEDGSATIEAVLWLPVFFILFCAVVDVSFVFHKQAEAYRVVQDANRAFSVGRIASTADTEDFIETMVQHLSPGAAATTSVSNGIILSQLSLPVEDLDATGFFSWLTGYNVVVASEHFLEL